MTNSVLCYHDTFLFPQEADIIRVFDPVMIMFAKENGFCLNQQLLIVVAVALLPWQLNPRR
jgi:hypothetical protein